MNFVHKLKLIYVLGSIVCLGMFGSGLMVVPEALAQQTDQAEELAPVTVEPPAEDERRISARTGQSDRGFGGDGPAPSGQPFSDYSLTPSEVVSPTGRTTNLSKVHSAVSVIESTGISGQGKAGLSAILQGTPGLWTSSFNGNVFDAAIAMRGFANESPNRVSLLSDGVPMNIPRQEFNSNFIFPELIERVEVLRGDGTVQFGNKAIGGAVNVILKKPRQHPGTFIGAEAGSWGTNREWAGVNFVRNSIAFGIFMGRYAQEGWRTHYGMNEWDEPVPRPGPWSLYNVYGSFNWKITPRLTFDLSHLISDQRVGTTGPIDEFRWARRDTRDVGFDPPSWGYMGRPFDDFPEERRDNLTIGKLTYDGDWLGQLEISATSRLYDRSYRRVSWGSATDIRWTDYALLLKYTRSDEWQFIQNALTLGNDHFDGRINQEQRTIDTGPYGSVDRLTHNGRVWVDRTSLSYYLINQTTLWERIVAGLGYRIENYDLVDIWSQTGSGSLVQGRIDNVQSASQYSLGLIYDKELGSSLYYRHSRNYRFANFDDMVNLYVSYPYHPDPLWLIDPEEGTLKEFGIRHWFTPNIFLSAIYYELDMDSEIFWGPDPSTAPTYASRNLNVRDISHAGLELEAMVRITPRWTLAGNYTRQKVHFRSDWQPNAPSPETVAGKLLPLNPSDMGHLTLKYESKSWGFSGLVSGHYIGSRYRIDDIFNEWPELEGERWGDIAFSQSFFGGLTRLYFGVNNFSDRQISLQGRVSTYNDPGYELFRWSNPGRTWYFGMESGLDFDRMRLPTTSDLRRMQARLYGALDQGASPFTAMGSWFRNRMPF